jgi:hypothetical protein
MIGHDDVTPYAQAFIFSAVIKTIHNDIPVYFAAENIDPIHHLKR